VPGNWKSIPDPAPVCHHQRGDPGRCNARDVIQDRSLRRRKAPQATRRFRHGFAPGFLALACELPIRIRVLAAKPPTQHEKGRSAQHRRMAMASPQQKTPFPEAWAGTCWTRSSRGGDSERQIPALYGARSTDTNQGRAAPNNQPELTRCHGCFAAGSQLGPFEPRCRRAAPRSAQSFLPVQARFAVRAKPHAGSQRP